MLNKVKSALQISTNDFDSELNDLIAEAKLDLGLANITNIVETNPLISRCIIMYCGFNFEQMHGSTNRSDAYKRAYKDNKAMLSMATGFTTW